jgi:hypothetical protein
MLLGTLGIVCFVTGFYQEENWRGQRSWERCKRQLDSKGQKLDWAAWSPAPIPDSENFFAAPQIKDWFTGPSPSEFNRRFSAELANLVRTTSNRPVLAHITILSPETQINSGEADIVLRYVSPGKAAFLQEGPPGTGTQTGHSAEEQPQAQRVNPSLTSDWAGREIIPLVIFDEVPLQDAIKNLARQGGLTCVLDPSLFQGGLGTGEPAPPLPVISMRLENVTAEQALIAVLNRFGFELLPCSRSDARRVRYKPAYAPEFYVSTGLREFLRKQIGGTLGQAAAGAQGRMLLAQAADHVKPVRIAIQTEQIPTHDDLTGILPGLLPGPASVSLIRLSSELLGGNGISVYLDHQPFTASNYLAWSDQFTPDFKEIQDALKRPGARLAGNYLDPSCMPRMNPVTVRILVQLLAQRAQAHLLLDQPQAALEEISLIHKLRRPLGAKPVGLVAAIMNVAVTSVYEDVVADGLRLGMWKEPQLVLIQKQLREIDLPTLLAEGLQLERAVGLQQMTLPPYQLGKLMFGITKTNALQKFLNPALLAAHIAPRGWRYENMVLAAQLQQRSIDTYDATRHLIVPENAEKADRAMQSALKRWSPRSCLAAVVVPNFSRAWISAARSQTLANEALIACALERYRLAAGRFPEDLQDLTPQFIDSLPQDVITGAPFRYRRLSNSRFLLYSPGWNQVDEGGMNVESPMSYPEQGDWVWRAEGW